MPAGDGGQPLDQEPADAVVVPHVVVLALVDVDLDRRLPVVDGAEHLAARGRQRRVAVDDRREAVQERNAEAAADVVQALDAQRVRRDVDQHRADVGPGDDRRLARPPPSPRTGPG